MMFQRLTIASPVLLSTSLVGLLLAGCPNTAPTAPSPSASVAPSRASSPAPAASPAARTAAAIDADACEHFQHGPITGLMAADKPSADAPLVSKPHTAFDLTLPNGGQDPTYVRYSVSKAGDYVFYLDKAVALTVQDEARATVAARESAAAAAGCPTAKLRRVYTLGVGTYTLQIGPVNDSTVNFVAIAADEPGDEH